MIRFALSLIVVLAAMLPAASASAATRYASPTGLSNPTCLQISPCDLTTALNAASGGDEVILLSGTYNVAPTPATVPGMTTPAGVVIHGESSSLPPLVKTAPSSASSGFVVNFGVTLRDVRVSYEGANATGVALYAYGNTTIDRVYVDGGPNAWGTCSATHGALYMNTVCIARNGASSALLYTLGMGFASPSTYTSAAVVRNSVFASTGAGGNAALVSGHNSLDGLLTVRLTAVNSIFYGTGAGAKDVVVMANTPSVVAEFLSQNSNYSTVDATGPGTQTFTPIDTAGNQSAEPLFANFAGGDFSQSTGSPTIDAGIDDPANGTLDLAGNPRVAGARTDIGAYEFQPPTPASGLSLLSFSPRKFRAAAKGFTVRPASARPKTKRGQKPIGSLLKLTASDAGEIQIFVFRALKGRRGKSGNCSKPSRKNAGGRRCTYYKRKPGHAATSAAAGINEFYFTGRWGSKKLTPGRYKVVIQHVGTGGPPPPSVNSTGPGIVSGTVTIVK